MLKTDLNWLVLHFNCIVWPSSEILISQQVIFVVVFSSRISKLQTQVNSLDPKSHNHGKLNELVSGFQRLYQVDRQSTLDDLNSLTELKEVHSLKGKILFSVIVVSYCPVYYVSSRFVKRGVMLMLCLLSKWMFVPQYFLYCHFSDAYWTMTTFHWWWVTNHQFDISSVQLPLPLILQKSVCKSVGCKETGDSPQNMYFYSLILDADFSLQSSSSFMGFLFFNSRISG